MVLLASALDPAGPAARDIDDLWKLLLWFGTAVMVLVVVLLVGALRRGHRRARHEPGATETGPDDPQGTGVRPWLVGGGVVLPTAGVVIVLVATIFAMRATADAAPDDALVVHVTGHQWWWEVSYADAEVVTANEVHIPAGEPVTLVLRSSDVIHSFWVPELAGKLDALPDHENRLVVEADDAGTYEGACAEFCGLQHANMAITVVAHSPEGFDAWLAEQSRPAAEPVSADADAGLEVFRSADCARCHTVRGTDADGERGPDLTHVASRRAIAGGALRLDADGLTRWLTDPHEVKEGTSMPDPELGEAEVEALVAYLEGLR